MENNQISAVILCYNEANNIRRCLDSIKGFCHIFVVDSGSTDETIKICQEYTDNIFEHPYANHASQWQWALENLPLQTDWILALDADFVVSSKLKQQMTQKLPYIPVNVAGIYVRHRYRFGGANIRFGGTKQYWLRIVKREHARADQSDLVDFRFLVRGQTICWSGDVLEYNVYDDDISVWLQKQDKFSLRLAVEEELRRNHLLNWEKKPHFFGNSDERIMWLRDKWLSLPLFIRPFIYFLYRYLFFLGFLDGKGGFLYHFLQGFWLRIVVDWKIAQIRNLRLTPQQLKIFKKTMLRTRNGSVRFIWTQIRDENVSENF